MPNKKFDSNYESKLHFDNVYLDNPRVFDDIKLYQIGDLFCENNRIIELHEQNCYEITYVMSGKGTFKTNEVEYKLKAGDLYICRPGQIHEGKADPVDPFRFFYLGFDLCQITDRQNPLINIQKTFDHINTPIIHDGVDISDVFIKFFKELVQYNDYSTEMIKMYIKQIIILTYRNFVGVVKDYSPKDEIDENQMIVYKVINYIENNIESIESLSLIAEKLGYSYYYISHLFTIKTGQTLQEYYIAKRFEKAMEMLVGDKTSITEIASTLKYGSIHSFSRAFKKYFGFTPSEYKKQKIKGDD